MNLNNFNDYQKKASEFDLFNDQIGMSSHEKVLGLCEEAGEVAGLFKRLARGDYLKDNTEYIFRGKLKAELGDVLWYLSQIAKLHNMTLQEVAENNIIKLEDRKKRDMIQGEGDER